MVGRLRLDLRSGQAVLRIPSPLVHMGVLWGHTVCYLITEMAAYLHGDLSCGRDSNTTPLLCLFCFCFVFFQVASASLVAKYDLEFVIFLLLSIGMMGMCHYPSFLF